jgi:hypothetical protein
MALLYYLEEKNRGWRKELPENDSSIIPSHHHLIYAVAFYLYALC